MQTEFQRRANGTAVRLTAGPQARPELPMRSWLRAFQAWSKQISTSQPG